jgi:hypothetical protein
MAEELDLMLHLDEDREVIRAEKHVSTVLKSHQRLKRFFEPVGRPVGRLR